MRPLKTRLRADSIPNEQRVVRGQAGRIFYIVLLGLFSVVMGNYLLGDFLLFNADGLVLSDEHVIATTYIARVESVDVKEGQSVEAGDPLITIQSSEILERLADLSTKRADMLSKVVDFKIRAENVAQLLPLAQRRVEEANNTIKEFDNLADARLVTAARYQEALRVSYEASRDEIALSTQRKVLDEELVALEAALDDADEAINRLQALYSNGVVVSPVRGSIGPTVPALGNVYRPGEPILSVFSGDPYVLAFLPRRYLFPVRIGMEVEITDGRSSAAGYVTEILPVTDALPKEFQNTFRPSDRSQLAKISIKLPSPFPLMQKVSVSRTSLWRLLAEAPKLMFGGGTLSRGP